MNYNDVAQTLKKTYPATTFGAIRGSMHAYIIWRRQRCTEGQLASQDNTLAGSEAYCTIAEADA